MWWRRIHVTGCRVMKSSVMDTSVSTFQLFFDKFFDHPDYDFPRRHIFLGHSYPLLWKKNHDQKKVKVVECLSWVIHIRRLWSHDFRIFLWSFISFFPQSVRGTEAGSNLRGAVSDKREGDYDPGIDLAEADTFTERHSSEMNHRVNNGRTGFWRRSRCLGARNSVW